MQNKHKTCFLFLAAQLTGRGGGGGSAGWAKCPTFSENGFWWPPWSFDHCWLDMISFVDNHTYRYDLSDPQAQHLVRLITESIQVCINWLWWALKKWYIINIDLISWSQQCNTLKSLSGGEFENSICAPVDATYRPRMDRVEQTETGGKC